MTHICPICGKKVGVKTMWLHIEGHIIFEPDLVQAWREWEARR